MIVVVFMQQDLAIDSTTIVNIDLGLGLRDIDIKNYIKIEKVPGGQLEDSRVLKGVMINKDVVAPGKMKRKIVNPRVILLDCPLEYKKGENQTNAELLKEEDWRLLLRMEEEYIEELCMQILRFKPDLVITEKGLSDLACHFLSKHGVSAIRRLRKTDNNSVLVTRSGFGPTRRDTRRYGRPVIPDDLEVADQPNLRREIEDGRERRGRKRPNGSECREVNVITNADEQVEMMRMLERRLEEMRKQHEEEMAAVRAECAAQIARGEEGVEDRRQEKTVINAGNEGEEHSSAPTRERQKQEKVDGGKEEKVLSVRAEAPTVLVPFAQSIMDFKMYDGTTDPDAHVKSLTNVMSFRTGCDAIWCRAFSLSLEGEALEWFNALPNACITDFRGLEAMFKKQFAACISRDITVVDLMNLKHGKEEPLKAFMDRYQKTVRRVKGLTLELALQHIMPALRPGPFKESVSDTAQDNGRVADQPNLRTEIEDGRERRRQKRPNGSECREVNVPDELQKSDVGTGAGLFEVKKIGDEFFASIVECKDPKLALKDLLNEVERNLQDAMSVARNIIKNPKLVPGGGATELTVSATLKQKSSSIQGTEKWPYEAAAIAFEAILRTLAQNSGVNVIRTMTALRGKHANGENAWIGINGNTGDITDMKECKIWDAYSVKAQTFKTAIEAACMLLRIDDVVSGIKRRAPGAGKAPSKPKIETEADADSELILPD
ncbi:hypothetical protein V8G54_029354 [Vigna mungo]|uniref:CCT-gamma n=1 Tax=Vigna mungo TaxID=3915 RepID=A0AAQ3RJ39_VIGMU